MDKKNSENEKRKVPTANYVPRRDYGELTEDEALEVARNQRESQAWSSESINQLYNPRRR